MAQPPTVSAANTHRVLSTEVTDFEFLMVVDPAEAARLMLALMTHMAPKAQPRIHTGYQPEATRRAVSHRRHCDGLHFNRGAVAA